MSHPKLSNRSRREFLKDTGVAAASALAFPAFSNFNVAEDNTIRVALVGAGGRGSGAAVNALSTQQGPVKLVSMADVFNDRIEASYEALHKRHESQVDVPPERRFVGLDAYKHAMDELRPGDVVILATPPAFRWVHLKYALDRDLHVFMEKPVTVDGPTSRRMFELAKVADEKNLKVGVGLMVRHCRGRQELHDRISNGEIGDVITLRAYRMHGPAGYCFAEANDGSMSDLMYQIRNFHSFLWASGGLFSDFYIHQIDECCWMKNKWPVQAHGIGGRHYRGDAVDQNFDTYVVEYTYDDGTKLFLNGRTMENTHQQMDSYGHGSKGVAVISSNGHTPGRVRIYDGHEMTRQRPVWAFPQPEPNPYQTEWDDLMDAIRNDRPFNEIERGVQASLVTSMGRMATHTGRIVTYDEILNSDHEFAPGLDRLDENSPAPVQMQADGLYPTPAPGIKREREY